MKAKLLNLIAIGILGLASTLVQADPPLRNGDAELVLDFLTAADGALDSPDDLLLDADPCDPDQPDLLEPVLAPDGQWITFGELSQVGELWGTARRLGLASPRSRHSSHAITSASRA